MANDDEFPWRKTSTFNNPEVEAKKIIDQYLLDNKYKGGQFLVNGKGFSTD